MGDKRFSNQTSQQILSHISKLLSEDAAYNLQVDPLSLRFLITESTRPKKKLSEKREQIKAEYKNKSKRMRKLSGTRKRTNPKIRTVKKGRTVALKGRTY